MSTITNNNCSTISLCSDIAVMNHLNHTTPGNLISIKKNCCDSETTSLYCSQYAFQAFITTHTFVPSTFTFNLLITGVNLDYVTSTSYSIINGCSITRTNYTNYSISIPQGTTTTTATIVITTTAGCVYTLSIPLVFNEEPVLYEVGDMVITDPQNSNYIDTDLVNCTPVTMSGPETVFISAGLAGSNTCDSGFDRWRLTLDISDSYYDGDLVAVYTYDNGTVIDTYTLDRQSGGIYYMCIPQGSGLIYVTVHIVQANDINNEVLIDQTFLAIVDRDETKIDFLNTQTINGSGLDYSACTNCFTFEPRSYDTTLETQSECVPTPPTATITEGVITYTAQSDTCSNVYKFPAGVYSICIDGRCKCVLVDCDLGCEVLTHVKNCPDSFVINYYQALKLTEDCNCNCQSMCDIYEILAEELTNTACKDEDECHNCK
jgi:hypothetical protein